MEEFNTNFTEEVAEFSKDNIEETVSEDSENTDLKDSGDETKSDKFKRLAAARTDKIVDGLEKLGNLSGNAYEYTDNQVEEMYAYIQNALNASKEKFSKQEKKSFSFSN